MTAEVRGLLERVEKHGGPVRAEPNIVGDYIVLYRAGLNYEGDGYAEEWCRLDVALNDRHADRIVGVLKRDLIERGAYEAYSGMSASDYVKGVNTTVGGVAKVEFGWADPFFGKGDTELEALLKAWLAAAEAEGWEQ